jgi:hypothetical protein
MSDTIKRSRPRREQADPEALSRLFEIPMESAEHLILANGPVSPDAALLDQAAEALHLMQQAVQAEERYREILRRPKPKKSSLASLLGGVDPHEARIRAQAETHWDESRALIQRARTLMRALAKQQAQTAAGIYAKALVVRGSRTGAEVLARSLARDLAALPALRASLWQAEAIQ